MSPDVRPRREESLGDGNGKPPGRAHVWRFTSVLQWASSLELCKAPLPFIDKGAVNQEAIFATKEVGCHLLRQRGVDVRSI